MGQKILVASISDLLRFGLRKAFQEDCHDNDIHEATSSEELRSMLLTHTFDLAIIQERLVTDMHLLSEVSFILITTEPDMDLFQQAYRYRARGYVSENINANLLRSILHLDKGTFFLDPALFPWMMEHILRTQETSAELHLLSPREREIFGLLQEGVDRRTIARKLHISDSTLKTHIKNINRKREAEQIKKSLLPFDVKR